uniref:Uncharacterized protein n=1 Tax=Anopheles minimus TaxID=112268 RepID=A0A182WD54_9DIPT
MVESREKYYERDHFCPGTIAAKWTCQPKASFPSIWHRCWHRFLLPAGSGSTPKHALMENTLIAGTRF